MNSPIGCSQQSPSRRRNRHTHHRGVGADACDRPRSLARPSTSVGCSRRRYPGRVDPRGTAYRQPVGRTVTYPLTHLIFPSRAVMVRRWSAYQIGPYPWSGQFRIEKQHPKLLVKRCPAGGQNRAGPTKYGAGGPCLMRARSAGHATAYFPEVPPFYGKIDL